MKIGAITNAAAVIALGLAAWAPIQAQPLYDRVNVNLPYTVTIGDKTLQPGEYTIQQLQTTGGDNRIVLIYGNNGMKFETSAMAIPALDPNTARDTKLILHQVGSDYYLDKIWIQGKDYGYEFPLPNSVKSREKEMAQAVSVPAQYSTSQSSATSESASNTANQQPANNQTETKQAVNTSPQTDNTTPQTTTPPVETTPPPVTDNSTSAQNAQPQQYQPQNSADRSADMNANNTPSATTDQTTDTTSMPHTSAGWLMMLLTGGTLSGAGLSLRRKR